MRLKIYRLLHNISNTVDILERWPFFTISGNLKFYVYLYKFSVNLEFYL